MPNPLDFLLRDPNAMRYELMRDQANLKKGGEVKGKAMGGTLTQPNPVPTQQRTPPGGAMRNISWAQYREAIGLKQGGAQNYAGGGKVYSGQLPDSPSVDKAEEPKTERSWLDTLGGLGETGLSLLTGIVAQPAAGIAGAAGETLGFGKGEDIADRVAQGLTYAPTTAAGQQMQQDLMDFMVKTGVASLPPVVSGINPAALRVMPGTGRYVGQQAIETARPLHEAYMAGEVPGVPAPASYVVKPKGGNWYEPSVQKVLETLKGDSNLEPALINELGLPQEYSAASPVSKWIDTKLAKYIKNEMGTQQDPLRALAEKGKLHIDPNELPWTMIDENTDVRPGSYPAEHRKSMGFPAESVSKTVEGRNWEASADMAIKPVFASDISPDELKTIFGGKTNPENPTIYGARLTGDKLGFDHLIDELRNATDPNSGLPKNLQIDPAKLDRMTVPQVVERVADINAWRAEQAKTDLKEFPVVYEGDKGYKIYDIKLPETSTQLGEGLELREWIPKSYPDKRLTGVYKKGAPAGSSPEEYGKSPEEAIQRYNSSIPAEKLRKVLKNEGEIMGHCVGGENYCRAVEQGETNIYSLRDAKNTPHATIETEPADIGMSFGSADPALRERIISQTNEKLGVTGVKDLEKTKGGEALYFKTLDELYRAELGGNTPPPNIIQIKGKSNITTLKPEYQEHLKNFLNSREWGKVNETGGLIDLRNQSNLVQKIVKLSPGIKDSGIVAENLRAKLPRFITEDELKAALGVDGYARGGAVKTPTIAFPQNMNYNVDDMRHALARR